MPIASLTKLMTAMVVLDAGLSLEEKIEITKDDRDLIRLTGSRLKYGARLTRRELVTLALMSSENRAAAALSRTHPGGKQAFIDAMNAKAKSLGMHKSHFADAAGLDAGNIASAEDLPLRFGNTNRLLRNKAWDIQISKTGYINEAGRCLVMHTEFEGTPAVLVLLNSYGKLTPFGDANRVRKWIRKSVEQANAQQTSVQTPRTPEGG